MDQGRQAESGRQDHFALVAVNFLGVDVTLDRPGNRVLSFGPAPLGEGPAEELQAAARGVESDLRLAIYHGPHRRAGWTLYPVKSIGGDYRFGRRDKRSVVGREVLMLDLVHAILP